MKNIVGDKMTNQKTYYITSHGTLRRDKDTLLYESGDEKKHVPVESVRAIIVLGNLSLKGGVIPFLAEKEIPVQFHSQYGHYQNTLQNIDKNMNGHVLKEQSRYTLSKEKRLELAKKFTRGGIKNLSKNLKRKELEGTEKKDLRHLSNAKKINEIMSIEGRFRKEYYSKIDTTLPENFRVEKRSYNPPKNRMNALISFGNSLIYSAIMSEIYHTQLHPAISYLHEPYRQRYSLALDISEIFKPILVDRVIHKLVNRKEIQLDDFQEPLENFYLKESARDVFVKKFDEKLDSTLHHSRLNRNVSYRRLLRLEAYKIQKHVLKDEEYTPYIISR